MNLSEATKRLAADGGNQEALREYYNRFDAFISFLVRESARLYPDFDSENAEQELRQVLLEIVDRYDPSYTEAHWDNFVKKSLRNRLNDIIDHFYVEKKHVPMRLEETVPVSEKGDEKQRLEDQLVSLEQDVYDVLQSQHAEEIIDQLQSTLSADSSKESQLGLSVLNLILEASPEELTLRSLTEALRASEPESKWHPDKVHDVLNYLRYKLERAGFSEDWAVA